MTFIERPPGGAFGAPVKLARVTDPAGGVAIARLHDSGAAAIAWSGNYLMQVRMATRPGLGGFRPPVTVAKGDPLPKDFDPFWFSPAFAEMSGGIMFDNSLFFGEALTLTADGRALLGVTARGAETYVARLATAPLTGAAGINAGAGGEFDIPLLTQPFVLADGTPALSWITNVGENHFTLHLATEGGTRPASGPAPRVRFGAPVRRVLDYDDALRLPFTCSGPCSVRAQIVGHEYSDGVATRFSAGSDELRIFSNEPIAAKGRGTVRVRVKYGAPDSVDLKTRDAHRARAAFLEAEATRQRLQGRAPRRLDPRQLPPLGPAELRAAVRLRQPEPRRPRQPARRHDRDGRAPGEVLPRDAAPGGPGALRHPAHDRRARPARADDGQGPLMRVALVALALLAATPATAGAQFGQVEPLTLRGDDDCVRTTGAPGELALPATDGVRFAQATPHGCPAGPDRHAGQGVRVLRGRHARERRGRDRGEARTTAWSRACARPAGLGRTGERPGREPVARG